MITSCKVPSNTVNNHGILEASKSISTMAIHADIMSISKTLHNLYSKSHAVIIGTVTDDTKQIKYNDIVNIAVSSVKVEQVLKGGLSAGETISIEETGVRKADYDISIEGAP